MAGRPDMFRSVSGEHGVAHDETILDGVGGNLVRHVDKGRTLTELTLNNG